MEDRYESIADGLARHGYAITDNFLSTSEVDNILNTGTFAAHINTFRRAGTGKRNDLQINEAVRGDYIQWIDKNTAAAPLLEYLRKLDGLSLFLNRNLYLGIRDSEIHLTVYPPGAFYKRHLDQFKKDDHRKLSVICYLNKGWKDSDGGQLRMYTSESAIDVLPLQGRLVCFRSDQLEHEVLPATRDRLSLTGWMLNQQKDIF